MPSRTLASDAKITIASFSDLHSHFDDLYDDLHTPETEHTWQKIERALLHIQAITRGGAPKYGEFVALLKDAAAPINNALLSERTKLSGTAGDLLNSIAPRMAERFEPLVAVFVPTLLLICARTNKVAVKRAEKSLHFIVKHCRPPSVVVYLKEAIKDKGQGLRAVAAATLEVVLEHTEKERLARRVGDIEACIKSGATDSNPEVRQTTKRLFELYVAIWPERVEQFTKPMTPTIRRYLSLPKTGALIVEVPPLTEAPTTKPAHSSRSQPQSATQHTSRQDNLVMPASHAPPSRTAPTPAYNFFPDLTKSAASSSTVRMQAGPGGFSMNDASYGKRGLFAEQIAAARNARLARMPSFNFEDVPKSSENVPTIKRQPSFDQLRAQPAAPAATFRVPRFDVVVAPTSSDGRPRSAHEPAQSRDINANTPSFAAASGLHGKRALLAAYKQAFAIESGSAKPASTSRERHHRDPSDKPSKHDKRREKTVAVRFDSDSKHDDPVQHAEGSTDELPRSKSAPQIHVDKASNSAGINDVKSTRTETADWADSDDEVDRPSTPPERILHAQTPRTGVKASRVPAQRVAMPSAVKVSAMRVAVPTPSAKVAAGRVVGAAESSPSTKARVQPVKVEVATGEDEAKGSAAQSDTQEKAEVDVKEVDGEKQEEDKKEAARVGPKEEVREKPAAVVKKPATSTAAISKQPVKAVAAKSASSASIAAKARLEARAAGRPATTTAAAVSADSRTLAAKPVSTAAKPIVVRKPVSSSSKAAKPVSRPAARPAATAASSVKPSKPSSTVKPTTTTNAAVSRPKPTTAPKPTPASTAPSTTTAAAKKPEPSTTTAAAKKPEPSTRASSFMAPTASTRNKVVPAAAVKKFQPKPSTSIVSRPKSSIATSLAAKNKVLGRPAASDKSNAVRKAAGATVVARMKERRASGITGRGGVDEVRAGAMEKVVVEWRGEEESKVAAEVQVVVVAEAELNMQQEVEVAAEEVPREEEAAANEGTAIIESKSTAEPVPAVELSTEDSVSASNIDSTASDSTRSEAQMGAEEEQQPLIANEEPRCTEAAAPSSTSSAATPAKAQISATAAPPAAIRTPLSSKDHNVPRAVTPLTSGLNKIASPLLPTSHIKSEPARTTPAISSPLGRTTPSPSKSLLTRFVADTSSSFEESDSEEEEEEDTEQVVQLQFRARPVSAQQPAATSGCKVVAAAGYNKQLVLGFDSSDDSGVMPASEGDETVLLEHAV